MKLLILLFSLISFTFATMNINNSDVKTLETLNAIGSKKAQAIIEYRKKSKANLTASQCE